MATSVKSGLTFKKGKLSKSLLLDLHRQLVFPRVIEEKMLSLLRQGKISKWFSGIGQEAISVGCAMALQQDELIFTMHRNLGVFTARNVPFEKLFAQWQGKTSGFSKGRERSFHFGTLDYGIVGMISHLGPQLSLADGVGLAHKLKNEQKVALAFTGEGGTSEGEFHEALNVAAVWDLPVIFVIENNGYGLSTPTNEQYKCEFLADRAKGYGMEGITIDGNNILEVYQTIQKLAKDIRKNPRPVLVECLTFRMRGHEEASGTKYVPKHLMEEWALKDPISNFENYLIKEGLITESESKSLKAGLKKDLEKSLKTVFDMPEPVAHTLDEINDVYRPFDFQETKPGSSKREMRFVDAVSDGLKEAMKKHDNLVLMGQDIAEYGGVFKITDGFVEEFGKERVRNTPLCESAIIGAGLGLSLEGYKSMVEMQFADFVSCGFNQIVNNLAKIHYRWGPNADIVIRMPTGAGVGAGPFHSQSNEAWFTHVPGLKVVYPSTPEDAKGLLLTSFEDPNPVMFFEHKGLYRSLTAEVPEGYYTTPFGKARVARSGAELSIITYGMGVHWALKTVEKLGIDAEVIDLRTLVPMDVHTIHETVEKTGKVLVLHEDTLFGGIGGEIAAFISEHLFKHLDAPVIRVASLDTPVPFAIPLEKNFLAESRLEEKLKFLQAY
ncbi:MAG: dehydrogenase E1 component subunit alpha/beta [Saprospiraceae bacterium]